MNTTELSTAAIKAILAGAANYRWSVQGLGMLRLYLSPTLRLHVWDDRFIAPGATLMHDHPWHFESLIVAGQLVNYRYILEPARGRPYVKHLIKCGEGGGLMEDNKPDVVFLTLDKIDSYGAGMTYRQTAEEVHCTRFARGTVTVIDRKVAGDPDHAHVYYPQGGKWGSAEPRLATTQEVMVITQTALSRFFRDKGE